MKGLNNQRYALWKRQLPGNAARVFDAGVGIDAEHAREREIEKLHAKVGQLTVENSEVVLDSGTSGLRHPRIPTTSPTSP